MSLITTHPTSNTRRIVCVSSMVFLSFALPIGIACWSVASATSGKLLGQNSGEIKIFQGSLKNGELWFFAARMMGDYRMPQFQCRFKALNLETGIERDTGLELPPGEFGSPYWFGDQFYVATNNSTYRVVDGSLVRVASGRTRSSVLNSGLFLYQGQITTVVETADDGFCLCHLKNDQWVEGGRILLPKPGREWYDDQQRNRKVLLPLTSAPASSAKTTVSSCSLIFIQHCGQTHLFLTNANGFAAYRNGFEFEEDSSDVASALACKNAPNDVTGWEPIQPWSDKDRWISVGSDQQGLLFSSWGHPVRFVRRTTDGHWENVIKSDGDPTFGSPFICENESNAASYIVYEDQRWSSAIVSRVDGNTILPAHLIIAGCKSEYLARWQRLLVGLLIAWFTHVAMLVGGTLWLTKSAASAEYEFGIHKVTLASTWQRGLALIVDAILLATIVLVTTYFQAGIDQLKEKRSNEREICESFFNVEGVMVQGGLQNWGDLPARLSESITLMVFGGPLHLPPTLLFEIVLIGLTITITMFCLRIYFQGRYGSTPGKWLLGICTVRSTLRPCGFVRALARDLLYSFDFTLLMTPIPIAICMMLSPLRQRLGDRVADTIVIRSDSIREVDRHRDK